MGVIARVLGQPQMVYFVKGAPEKVHGEAEGVKFINVYFIIVWRSVLQM